MQVYSMTATRFICCCSPVAWQRTALFESTAGHHGRIPAITCFHHHYETLNRKYHDKLNQSLNGSVCSAERKIPSDHRISTFIQRYSSELLLNKFRKRTHTHTNDIRFIFYKIIFHPRSFSATGSGLGGMTHFLKTGIPQGCMLCLLFFFFSYLTTARFCIYKFPDHYSNDEWNRDLALFL